MKAIEIKNSRGKYTYKVDGKRAGARNTLQALVENSAEYLNAEIVATGIKSGDVEVTFRGLARLEGFDSSHVDSTAKVASVDDGEKLVNEIFKKTVKTDDSAVLDMYLATIKVDGNLVKSCIVDRWGDLNWSDWKDDD